MDINNRRHLHAVARDRLGNSQAAPKIALIYGGVVVGASFLSTTVSFLLSTQIDRFGGLSNLGLRSVLSTVQSTLPFLLNFILMALELGFVNAMLRVSRRQFTSPQTFRMGFERFWLLLKTVLLQSGLYFLAGMASFYLASQLFLMTPLSHRLMSILNGLNQQGGSLDLMAVTQDPAFTTQLTRAVAPMLILMFVVLLAVAIPIFYHYRMVNFVIIDKPGIGALAAMRESRMMMRRNCMKVFRLDLSMWWYFVASALSLLLCYGDLLLSMLGIQLPFSETVSYFLFLFLYLAANMAVIFFLRPHVEVAFSLAYDSIRPQDPPQNGGGAVLGNIFNM